MKKSIIKLEYPDYYAIIPVKIRYDEILSNVEILLYGKITALFVKIVIVGLLMIISQNCIK